MCEICGTTGNRQGRRFDKANEIVLRFEDGAVARPHGYVRRRTTSDDPAPEESCSGFERTRRRHELADAKGGCGRQRVVESSRFNVQARKAASSRTRPHGSVRLRHKMTIESLNARSAIVTIGDLVRRRSA